MASEDLSPREQALADFRADLPLRIELEAIVPPELFGRVKQYIPGYAEPKEDWER